MDTPISLPRDKRGADIDGVLNLDTNATVLTIGAASVRAALPSGSQIVRLAASGACHFKFGSNTVAAAASDSHLLPANAVEYVQVPSTATDIAVIQNGAATGSLTVSKVV